MKKNSLRIGINGFGRIGRIASRIILRRPHLTLVAINSRATTSSHAYLLKYDSTYGVFPDNISFDENNLFVQKTKIAAFACDNPADIPWSKLGVDVVIDSTGKFRTSAELENHLKGGVKLVVLSAPAKDQTKTLVLGVNASQFSPKVDKIISNSSCTTNCLATTLKVLHDKFKVKRGFMTTIHAVTDSQNLLDNSHKAEIRLRRSAFASMIPTQTGSTKDISKLFPELAGKIICQAIRIPLFTVSLINLTCEISRTASRDEINEAYRQAAKTFLKGILEVAADELVSKDFSGNTHSAIFDPYLTSVAGGNMVNIYAWYDNEWGYTERLVDMVEYVGKKIKDIKILGY